MATIRENAEYLKEIIRTFTASRNIAATVATELFNAGTYESKFWTSPGLRVAITPIVPTLEPRDRESLFVTSVYSVALSENEIDDENLFFSRVELAEDLQTYLYELKADEFGGFFVPQTANNDKAPIFDFDSALKGRFLSIFQVAIERIVPRITPVLPEVAT